MSHGVLSKRGGLLIVQRPGVLGQMALVPLHTWAVWFRVMLQTFCVPLVILHTVLLYGLRASSHVQAATDVEEQKLSHMK